MDRYLLIHSRASHWRIWSNISGVSEGGIDFSLGAWKPLSGAGKDFLSFFISHDTTRKTSRHAFF